MKFILIICALAVFIPAMAIAWLSGEWLAALLAGGILYPLAAGLALGFNKLISAALNLVPR